MTQLTHPGAKPRCARCGGLGLDVVQDGAVLKAVPCSCVVDPCPACKGAGFVAVAPGPLAARTRCACQAVAARARTFDAVRLPGRYAKARLKTFGPGSGDLAAHGAAIRLLTSWRVGDPNRGLVVWGDVGRGKTHLIVALLRELVLQRGLSARFVEFTHLVSDLKAAMDRGNMGEILDPLAAVDVLVIDELGKGRTTGLTEYEGVVLDEIVSRRYNAMRPILATSNYSPRAEGEVDTTRGTRTGALVERIGERVFSRLVETCDFVRMSGDDRRQMQALAARHG